MNSKKIRAVRQAAMDRFPMNLEGIHGIRHWDRVAENALYLGKHSGWDLLVCELFAYLHDCCRESDGHDPEHGERAADYALGLRSGVLIVSDEQFELLRYACAHHEKGRTSDHPTIGACWDADRLDLGRVGIFPNAKYLSTDRAKRRSVIDWATARSHGRKVRLKF